MDDNFETLVKNPILKVSCDDIPPCTPPDDKHLESWIPCDIFETQLFGEDCFKQNEECSQGLDTNDEASLPDCNCVITFAIGNKVTLEVCMVC